MTDNLTTHKDKNSKMSSERKADFQVRPHLHEIHEGKPHDKPKNNVHIC